MTYRCQGWPAAPQTDPPLPDAAFEASAQRDGEGLLRVSGELDAAAAPLLRDRLADVIEATTAGVVVDLAHVSFIDSSGLAVLVQAHQQLEATMRTLRISRPSRSVTRMLEITGLDALFDSTRQLGHGPSADGV